jgi:FHA domain/Domain of unknown function (DUF1707)
MLLALRASERDRLRAVETLKRGYLEGRLSTGTFEARVAVAQRASSRAALRELLADLRARWLVAHAALDHEERPALEMTLILSRSPRSHLLLGRSRSCDLILATPAVSRRHALLERTADGWRITDLHSTNGTFVAGARVESARIDVGARLRLGDALLRVA